MKLFFSIITSVFFFYSVQAQSNIEVTEYTVPVFPGCEKIEGKQGKMECFQKGLTTNYTKQLEKYLDAFEYLNIPSGESDISFTVRSNGQLILKDINSNEPLYKDYNVLAFDAMLNEMEKNNQKITAAQSLEKENLNVNLSFPVGFKLSHPVEENENRLICVLNDEDNIYEVVLTPNKYLKIYEVGGVKPFYLGKFNSLQEIKNTLPYKNLIPQDNELVTLAQSDFKEVKLILQTKNIFQSESFYTLFIVYQVKGKKIK